MKIFVKSTVILASLTLAPALSWAGLGRSLGAGAAAGVGAGLATGSPGVGAAVGGGTAAAGLLGGCSPREAEANLQITERALNDLAQRAEFQSATVYKNELARINKISNPELKLVEYYKMVGINPNNPEAVVEFLSERDYAHSRFADNVISNLNLSESQAVELLHAVTTSIAGDLR